MDVCGGHELLQLFFLAVVILYLDTDNHEDSTIDSYTVDPTVRGLLDRLNDCVQGTETNEKPESEI